MQQKIKRVFPALLLTLVYFLTISTLLYLRWRAHFPSMDYHSYIQMYWNTSNGNNIFEYNANSETIYPLFEEHFTPFLLYIFPIYLLIPHALTLYIIFFALISTSVVPLYLLALEKFKSGPIAILLSLSFLLYFPLNYTHLHGFAEESFATPLIFWAFYFLQKNRSWLFLFFCFLTLSIRINMTLPIFLLSIYSIVKNKSRSQGIFACLLSIFWLLFVLNVIYPIYKVPNTHLYIVGFFNGWGNTIGEIAKNMITHPAQIISIAISEPKLKYLLDLFGPLLFLPILCPEILILGIPTLLLNMLSNYPRMSHSWTYYHSSSLPFIWLALITSLERISKIIHWVILKISKRVTVNTNFIVIFLVSVILILNVIIDRYSSNGQHLPFSKFFNKKVYEYNIRDQEEDIILKKIPSTFSVASHYGNLEHISQRKWQFPVETYQSYLPDFLLTDPLSLTGEQVSVKPDDFYTKIYGTSFISLFARKDLVNTYTIKEFVGSVHKQYNPESTFFAVANPYDYSQFQSGDLLGTSLEINETYQLAQKIDFKLDNPLFLDFPIGKVDYVKEREVLGFVVRNVIREGKGNLLVEIREGESFKTSYSTTYSKIFNKSQITFKPDNIRIDLSEIKILKGKTYWLVLSLDETRKNKAEKFNKFYVNLTNAPDKEMDSPSQVYYSLDNGNTWSNNTYQEKNMLYSITFGSSLPVILSKTPNELKSDLERAGQELDNIILVGTITEPL